MKFDPHQYQLDAIDKMANSYGKALFADPGLGKTAITLYTLLKLRKPALIVAPLEVVYRVWPAEIEKWDDTKGIKYTILHGPNKKENLLKRNGIYLINPDGLKWLIAICQKLRYFPFEVLVIDESTEFKNYRAKRFTDHLGPMLNAFKHRYILSGTPVTKSYLDLWSQYYIVDRGKRLGDNYHKFKGKFFYQADRNGYDWQPFPGSKEAIRNLVSDITIRISGSDHLDLPEVVHNLIEVSLPKKAKESYKEMAKEMLIEFENGQIADAANAAVKSNKLHCIANGFLYLNDIDPNTGKKKITGVVDIHDAKLDALESLIRELDGEPLLVGFHFRKDLLKLKSRFPKAPHFGSDVDRPTKQAIENNWNAGKIPLLFAQIHSTARGLNLQQSGHHVAFYSLVWPWDDTLQFIGRVARQGQKSNRVFVHFIMAKQTIDHLIYERLKQRDSQSEEFLNYFRQHLLQVGGEID